MTNLVKYGFIYVWFDKKTKRYYIGSHWGTEDDCYICSSKSMRDNHKYRPQDFKRRIVARIYTSRIDLIKEEQRWLDMIDRQQFGRKYYNINSKAFEQSWFVNDATRKIISEKMMGNKNGAVPCSSEKAKKISEVKRRKFEEKRAAGLPCYEGQALENLRMAAEKRIGTEHTQEWKDNNSKKMKAYWKNNPEKKEALGEKMKGNTHAKANKGRKLDPKQVEMIRERESLDWIVTSPKGEEISVHNLNEFCRQQKLTRANIYRPSGSKGWYAVKKAA